jgi:hypothetical protein
VNRSLFHRTFPSEDGNNDNGIVDAALPFIALLTKLMFVSNGMACSDIVSGMAELFHKKWHATNGTNLCSDLFRGISGGLF